MGAFITLKPPTKDMLTEAVAAGFYKSEFYGTYPKLQVLTIEEILSGAKLRYPHFLGSAAFKRAERQSKSRNEQTGLF